MNFSNEWDQRYQQGAHLSIFPWSDLVSLVMRHRPTKNNFRVLEIGCGAGANIPLFLHLEADYYAIEGSAHIVEKLNQKYPQLLGKIQVGDFTQPHSFSKPFDLIIDRAALTHNSTAAIVSTLKYLHRILEPNGKYIGVDWFSTQHSDYFKGKEDQDSYTRCDYNEGTFTDVGRVHFADKEHLQDLFKDFRLDYLAHKINTQLIPAQTLSIACWNLVATKI